MRRTALLLALATGCGVAAGSTPKKSVPATTVETKVAASVAAVDDLQTAFKDAIAQAGPAVVSIYSTKTVQAPKGHPLGHFFGAPQGPREQDGLGSGFIVDESGHIVTNNHVVEHADEIKIRLADDREFEAQLVGTDPATDLAVLKIDADDLHAVELGSSKALETGDWVLAIGNPFGLPRTVSSGIVSAVGRANVGLNDYENFIQTDAAVNPGNSGGPLVDLKGRVVGINSAIASRSGGNNGIAFAIPIDMAKEILDQLIRDGRVTRGHLGVMISDVSTELGESFDYAGEDGVLIQDVSKGSAADRGGLQAGDIVARLNGEPVADTPQFRAAIARHKPGTKVELKVWRDGRWRQIALKLGTRPGPSETSAPETAQDSGKLGIGLEDLTPQLQRKLGLDEVQGVLISHVSPGSPAAKAGLRPGDVLEQVEDTQVRSAQHAVALLRALDADQGIRLRVSRQGRGRFVFLAR